MIFFARVLETRERMRDRRWMSEGASDRLSTSDGSPRREMRRILTNHYCGLLGQLCFPNQQTTSSSIELKTAAAVDLTIPDTILARATRAIE